jgi:hypothetical protein
MKTLQRWVVGVILLFLFPFLVPLAVIWAIIYKIPVTIGGWIFELLEMKDESNK